MISESVDNSFANKHQDVFHPPVETITLYFLVMTARSCIASISLLGHGLTVKLSRVASPAGRIAAYLCGHFKCNLLLAQARPRMIQHLSS